MHRNLASVVIQDISFPIGMLFDHFKKLKSLSILQINYNPKLLSKWVPLHQWQGFWNKLVLDKSKQTLKKLCLSRVGLQGVFANVVISSLHQFSGLKQLDLSGNLMGVHKIPSLAEGIKQLGELISLDLSSNEVEDEGLSLVLDAVQKHNTLQDLNMSLNNLTYS